MMAADKSNGKRLLLLIVYCFAFFAILLVFASDLLLPESKIQSDFHSSFYVAGHMVLNGEGSMLYPEPNHDFLDASFNKKTHELFPGLPAKAALQFMYGPLNAVFFAPFALLAANYALLLFQIISILALFLICYSAAKQSRHFAAEDSSKPGLLLRTFETLSFCISFLPVFATIWIGQSGIIFGLLPFFFGLVLLNKGKDFQAGLVWSLLLLKPQFAPAAAMIAALRFCTGRKFCVIGGILGGLGLMLIFTFCLGPKVMLGWLYSLAASERIVGGARMEIPVYLVAGLPGALVAYLPHELKASLKWFIYASGFLLLALVLWLCRLLMRSRLAGEKKDALVHLLAVYSLVLYSPHLLIYDLCIYVSAGLSIFLTQKELLTKYRRSALCFWAFLNLYTLFVVLCGTKLHPLILSFGLVLLQIPVWKTVLADSMLRTQALESGAHRPP